MKVYYIRGVLMLVVIGLCSLLMGLLLLSRVGLIDIDIVIWMYEVILVLNDSRVDGLLEVKSCIV